MKKLSTNSPCPCGSRKKYKKCCRVYHQGVPAPSPARLFLTRYAAHAAGVTRYIVKTTHPESPHYQSNLAKWHEEIREFHRSVHFTAPKVLNIQESRDQATVIYYAGLRQGSKDISFTERGLFLRYKERWTYHSGERIEDASVEA